MLLQTDLPIHQLKNTLLALGDHIQCEKCKEVLKYRVKDVAIQWVNVKVRASHPIHVTQNPHEKESAPFKLALKRVTHQA